MAYQQAENLWFLLGFVPSDEASSTTQLPSINTWFSSENTLFEPPIQHCKPLPSSKGYDIVDSDYDSDVASGGGSDSESELPEAMQLQAAMDHAENLKLSFAEEDKINNLTFAAVALSVNDSMGMYIVIHYLFSFNDY